MPSAFNPFYTLNSANCSLVVDCRGNAPTILHWGSRLTDATSPEMLALLATRQELQACQTEEVPIALSPETAAGFTGSPGVQIHRNGRHWAVYTQIESARSSDNQIIIISLCRVLTQKMILALKRDSDVLYRCWF